MKNFYSLLILMMLCSSHGILSHAQYGPPWVKYNVGYNYILRGIDFPANQDNIGYISGESLTYNGDGIVLKTTNGGSSWAPVWTGIGMGLEGSCFVDENTGFVAGWPKPSSNWSGFGKTTDGGQTWTSPAVIGNVYYFTDVVFKDASNGILVGATNTSPVVMVTSNGGNSWVSASGVSGNFPQHACYVGGNTYFLTDNGGHIKKSVDNGLTWTTVHTINGLYLLGIDFFDPNHGLACGDYGVITITSDGGTTWQNQQVGTDIWHDAAWQDQDHLFCVGTPELVIESIDGGNTWVNGFPQSAHNAALYECIFSANGTGWICGSQGTLLKRQPSCTAAFTASATNICKGDQVVFTSQSTGNISTYAWLFPGGTPSSSNSSNPSVSYNSPGNYNVQLIVNNGYWSDTLLQTSYIHVTASTAPVISVNGNQLSSNISGGNQWYHNGQTITGANSQTYLALQSGWYWDRVTVNGCISDTSNNIYLVMAGQSEKYAGDRYILKKRDDGSAYLVFNNLQTPEMQVEVYSLVGKCIINQRVKENELSLGFIGKGVFVLRLSTQNSSFTSKLIIN